MQEVFKSSGASISYRGSVTAEVKYNNKVIDKRHFHNEGMPIFFKNLCSLLAGNSAAIKDILPNSIALYTINAPDTLDATTTWQTLWVKDEITGKPQLERVSPYLPVQNQFYDGIVDEVKFQFNIAGSSVTTNKAIHILALFPKSHTGNNDEIEAIAVYKLTRNNTWQPLTVKPYNNILIEWSMSFDNARDNSQEEDIL